MAYPPPSGKFVIRLFLVRFQQTSGTAPLPPDTEQRFTEAWPRVRLLNLYGITEGAGAGTRLASSSGPGSARSRRGDGVEIHGPDGGALPPGEEGEVWLRAPHAPRYWKDPEATAATWQDGWLNTGDLGYLDDRGALHLTGRLKELIIRGGYNISPGEIEDQLHAHPAISEAAVVGVPHDVLGEDLAAVVVPRRGAEIDTEALRAWLAERLADFEVPRRYEVRDALPRNAMGKVVKPELVHDLSAGTQG